MINVSKLTWYYCSQVLRKKIEKRWHMRRDWKTPTVSIEGAEVMRLGKLFHIQAVETRKARLPKVDSRVWPTISNKDEAERSR